MIKLHGNFCNQRTRQTASLMEITQQRLLHVTHLKAVIHRPLRSRDRIMEWNANTQSSREIWSAFGKKQRADTYSFVRRSVGTWEGIGCIDVTKGGERRPEIDQSACRLLYTPGASLLAPVSHNLSSSPKMFSFSAPSAKLGVSIDRRLVSGMCHHRKKPITQGSADIC
ncbi:hypothetical protein BJX65DRAFT_203453 [Aspergillus insuetus]